MCAAAVALWTLVRVFAMWTLRSPMAVFPAIAFGLGTWQIYRYDRKKRMLEHREARRLAPTEELPHDVDVKDCEFRHFVVRGEFDHVRCAARCASCYCSADDGSAGAGARGRPAVV